MAQPRLNTNKGGVGICLPIERHLADPMEAAVHELKFAVVGATQPDRDFLRTEPAREGFDAKSLPATLR